MMTCPSARGIDPFSGRERTAIRLATSRKKLSELPPDQLRFHQTSKSQAKELKGARFPDSRPHTTGQDEEIPLPSSLARSSWLSLPSPSEGEEVLQGRGMSWLISISFHSHSLSFAKGEGSPLMQATVTPQQRQAAKREIVRQMKQGTSPHEALVRSIVPMHRTTVYRLLKRVQREEESGIDDGRHGHPVKLRGEVLTCLIEHCQANPCVSSSTVQCLLQERFRVSISVSQLNRVRARLGLTRKPVPREKKSQKPASRLPQAPMNKQVDCYCWQQPPRPACSPNSSRPCHPQICPQSHLSQPPHLPKRRPSPQYPYPWQGVQQCAVACCSPCCFWVRSDCSVRGICAGIPPMAWRCSPDERKPTAIGIPKPFYRRSPATMVPNAGPMPSRAGPPISGIRPKKPKERRELNSSTR